MRVRLHELQLAHVIATHPLMTSTNCDRLTSLSISSYCLFCRSVQRTGTENQRNDVDRYNMYLSKVSLLLKAHVMQTTIRVIT